MHRTPRTLLPKMTSSQWSSAGAAFLALAAVALIALGIGMIYVPAGVIAAGLGLLALQYQFFGD